MAAKIVDPELVPEAQAIQARALYNEGDLAGAAKLLDGCWLQLGSSAAAVPAQMLRAVVHQALGTPLAAFAAESRQALRSTAAGAGTETAWQEQLLCLLEFGEAGNWEALDNQVQDLRSRNPGSPTDHALRTVAAALLTQALAAAGRAVRGLDAGLLAVSELPALERGVFFFQEFVLGRLVADYLALGDWESAERELADYAAGQPRAAAVFAGSIQVLRGYSLLRQGRIERAYQTLLPAVETLRLNDPLQVFRFGSALAFYVAARLGDAAQSSRLELDYKDAPQGSGSQELLATAYAAAASEYVTRDGKGLASLHTLATTPEVSARGGTLLELLALCWDLGDHSVIPLVHSLAGNVQGRWAAAMLTLADQWESADADALMEMAARLETEGFVNVAREAYARASSVLEAAGERRRSRQAVALREKCDHELGERFREGQFIAAAPTVHLTRREQDIVELAVQGLTDREIAQRLMVSVRTVEGHLYRTYVKLGVRSRDELSTALSH
jgi:DNA-binding CsgD family transcriptional regulator